MERILARLALVVALVAVGMAAYGLFADKTARDVAESPAPEVEPRPSSETAVTAPQKTAKGGDMVLRNRLDRLAERVAQLEQRRLSAGEPVAQPANTGAVAERSGATELGPLTQRIGGLESQVAELSRRTTQTVAAQLAEDDAAREAVTGLVQDELEKFRQERRERRQAIGDQVMDEMASEFANKANLTDDQFNQLYPALSEMRQVMRENFRAMRRGDIDFAEMKEKGKAARSEFDEKARSILDDDQFKLYEEEMQRRFGGRGFW